MGSQTKRLYDDDDNFDEDLAKATFVVLQMCRSINNYHEGCRALCSAPFLVLVKNTLQCFN